MIAQTKSASKIFLVVLFLAVTGYFIFLQFLSPCLYEVDGYYNVAVANFIKDLGPNFKFHWAQVSTYKDSYGDTEFLYHLSIIPFLYITNNLILAGKLCVIFYNILFFLALVFILKKYLPDFLAGLFLIFPLLSPAFTFYFLRLRAVTLAVILTILCVYCLINKRYRALFLLSLVYALSHPSFPTIIFFAIACEIIRRFIEKEFFAKNIYTVLLGSLAGCVVNPNFPNNVFTIFLNGIMVPIFSLMNKGIVFAQEVYTQSSELIFMVNFALFFTLIIILWIAFISRPKISFSTFVWWAAASFYFLISFKSERFWYPANVLFFIFFAAFLKDYIGKRQWQDAGRNVNRMIVFYAVIIFAFLPYNIQLTKNTIAIDILNNSHFERVARWMKANLPKGERVYHANGDNASYFLCLNPNNDYLVLCDPIYMFWRYPKEYAIFLALRQGRIENPARAIKETFGARYGYTQKNRPLYSQIRTDSKNFKILYEDEAGVVFEITGNLS